MIIARTHITAHDKALGALTTVALIGLFSLPIVMPIAGCSSSSKRSTADKMMDEINPAIAYAQRQKAEAIEHYNIASELHAEGKNIEAIAEYRKSLELNQKFYPSWNNMGQLLMSEGNFNDAVSAFRIASGLELEDPRPEYNIGLVYQKLGWEEDAFEHFQTALEREPHFIPALRGIIKSANALGLGNEQIMEYIRTAQLHDSDEAWRDYFRKQHYRVQALMDN